MKKFIFVLFLVFTIPYWVNGQCTGTVLTVNNPSFEGTPEAHVTPPGWDICMPGVTPDTQPGFWGQNLPPSNGSSYIGLVYQPSTGWQEGAGQTLSSPMVAGTSYNFTIDLAVPASADPATGIIVPPYCSQLQLWGGMSGVNSGCDQAELLWTSPVISNSTWQTYTLTFTPTQNWNHVLLLISSTQPPCTDGQYLMMDNMTPIIPQADVAEFGWTPYPNNCAGNMVSFHDSSTSTDGTIVSWAWNFGDGGTSTLQNPNHTFVNPGTYNVSLTIISTVPCTTNIVHQVVVYEIPTVTLSGGGSICSGGSTSAPITFTFTGLSPWSITYTNGTTPVTVNNITISPYTVNVSVSGTYTVTSISDAHCQGTFSGSATVNVYPMPAINNITQTICSGGTFTVTPVDGVDGTVPTGTTYTWSAPTVSGITGTAAGTNASTISGTLSNTTNSSINVVYTVTPTVGTCTGATFTVTVTVNSNATITVSASPASVCSGSSSTLTASGASTYTWMPGSLAGTSVTVAPSTSTTYTVTGTSTAGCTGSATVTLTVNTNASVSATASPSTICLGASSTLTGTGAATYSWMPGSPSGTSVSVSPTVTTIYTVNGTTANGCTGSNTVTVNVNPMPTVNSVPDQTYCNGAVAPLTSLSGPISGTSFTWTNSNTAVGLGANGIGNPPSFTAINTTTSPITATITITPTAINCVGPTSTYMIMVNPTPTVTTVPNQVYCNGAAAPATTLSSPVTGTSFTWTNSNASIGLGSSGSGNPPSFTATNSSSSPTTATVTITPTANACTGPTSNYSVTVNPTPTVTVPANITVCNTAVLPGTSFTSPTSGATYSWTNSNTSIGLAASGSGNIAAFTATNTTSAPISATITVTPSANNCTGTPSTYTITVNPTPTVTVPSNTSVCTGTLTPGSTFTSNITGTTYSWTNSGSVIGLAASGVGDVPSFTATNTSTVPVVATIVVTPSANGCTGPTSSYTITVNPLPVITFVPVAPMCYTSPSISLSQASPAGGTYSGPGVTGSIFDPAAAGIGTHTITYNYTNPATGCSNSATMQIVVTDGLTITVLPNNPFICIGDHISLTAGGASSFTWLPATGLSATNVADVIASPTITTTYTVTGTNPDGCIGSTTTTVVVYNVPVLGIVAEPDDGCAPLFVNFNYFPSGPVDTNTLHWNFSDLGSPDNNSTATEPSHNFLTDGSYAINLSALTTDGCPVSATDTVRAYKKPIADFYANPEVGYEDYPTINFIDLSVGANSWQWNFGDPASLNDNYSDIQNPFHIFADTGTHLVQLVVSTSQNCSDTIEKPMIIYPSIVIYIPNAFTPDNDHWNDVWKPIISGADQENYQLYVFDRWGKILFYTEDMNEGWDGSNKGKKCQEGVYVYMVMYKSVTGEEFKAVRGAVTLIK